MTVTVLSERAARQGYGSQLLQAILAHLRSPHAARPGRRWLCVLQHTSIPERVLTLAEWATQEDFQEYLDTHQVSLRVFDAWCTRPASRRLLEGSAAFERSARSMREIVCVSYAWPAEARAVVEVFVDQRLPTLMQAQEPCVFRRAYRDPQDPNYRFIMAGWEGAAPTTPPPEVREAVSALQAEHGLIVQRFIAHPHLLVASVR